MPEEAERARQGRPRTRVDVSDLGLTMDDLTGPMGGVGSSPVTPTCSTQP